MNRDISRRLGYDARNQGIDERINEGLPKEHARLGEDNTEKRMYFALKGRGRRERYNNLSPELLFDAYE